MMLINTDKAREALRHVYLKEARQLRTDLPE
jgi:chorismate mutase